MKLLTHSMFAALAVAFGLSGVSFGYEGATLTAAENYLGGGDCGCGAAPCGDVCGGCGSCDSCCGCCDDGGLLGGWGLFTEAELLFLRYHRADGIRIGSGAGESGEFDFEPAYRLSAGVVAPNGVGFRARFFEYDHFENIEDPGDGLGVNTYTLDMELFEAFALNQNWAMEISGGVRYCNFREEMIDVGAGDFREVGFNGAGLVTGLEARRALGGIGLLYARTRAAVVQDDKTVVNVDGGVLNQSVRLVDTTGGMLELAVGGEANYALANGAVLFARSGLEWQNWWNFSNEFDFLESEGFFDGASDVGFAGLTFSLGMSY